jgi:hypothetical protein
MFFLRNAARAAFGFLLIFPVTAKADCTNPAGPAGRIDYFDVSGEKSI